MVGWGRFLILVGHSGQAQYHYLNGCPHGNIRVLS